MDDQPDGHHQGELHSPSDAELDCRPGRATLEITRRCSSSTGEHFEDSSTPGLSLVGLRRSRRHQKKPCTLSIDEEVYDCWCKIGTAEGLKTDTEIASFFIKQYQGTQAGFQFGGCCVCCHAPLAFVCSSEKCRPLNLQNHHIIHKTSSITSNATFDLKFSQVHENSFSERPKDSSSDISEPHESEIVQDGLFDSATSVGCSKDSAELEYNTHDHAANVACRGHLSDVDFRPVKRPTYSAQGEMLGRTGSETSNTDTETVDNPEEQRTNRQSPKKGAVIIGQQQAEKQQHTKVFKCAQCQRAFRTACGLKQHENVHMNERSFKCHFCKAAFKWSSSLTTHMKMHKKRELNKCQTCKKCFKTVGGLKLHMKKHEDHVRFLQEEHRELPSSVTEHSGEMSKDSLAASLVCSYCGQTFDSASRLASHVKIHAVKEVLKCRQCSKTFSKPQTLKKHVDKAHKKKGDKLHECSECSATFTSSARLATHIRIHTGERPYICDFCGATFSLYSTLTVHRRTHTGEKPYQCQQCGEKFTWKKSLDYHMFKHTKTYASLCHLCGAWFRTPEHLADHLRRHADTRDFKCHMCDKGFKTKSDLYSHTMYIHPQKAKSFKCPECDLAFVTKSMLKKHSRKHTGERPYQCEHCSKTFPYFSSLSAHRKLHEGKKHTCEVCGASFVMQWGLSLHMRKHTGEKPYQCKLCGEAFSWHSGLKNHMKKHEI